MRTSWHPDSEYDQLVGRFSIKHSKFGILVCRKNKSEKKVIEQCKDIVNNGRGHILVFDDEDIKNLLEYRKLNKHDDLIHYLDEKFKKIIF